MYEILKFIFVGAIVLLGIFMAVCPQQAVKQEDKEDVTKLAGTRRNGIVLAGVGIVCGIVIAVL